MKIRERKRKKWDKIQIKKENINSKKTQNREKQDKKTGMDKREGERKYEYIQQE